MSLRPFFPYFGSKWNAARHYEAPRNEHVIEPFAGSAGYSTFYGCRKVTLVDADPRIAGVWSYLTRVSAEEILALPDIPEMGDSVDNYALPQEAAWLIGFWLNRGSSTPKKSRSRYLNDGSGMYWGPRAKQRIASQIPAIAEWRVLNQSYADLPRETATWFVDPPYVEMGKHYRCRDIDFEHLGGWCRSLPGQAIVCEGVNAHWLPFLSMGSFKSSRGRSEEFVWTNGQAFAL